MNNITVCIPTYKRPDLLEQLLVSINNNEIDPALINQVNLIIVDNDVDKTAEATVTAFRKASKPIFCVIYDNYPIKGLANVRNKLFSKALDLVSDYILCVDDDEYVNPLWLNQLTHAIIKNEADIVMGPVIPYFPKKVPKYISYHFRPNKFANNQQIDFLETNNFIISTEFIRKYQLKFDDRFNFTGGEDAFFGVQALKHHAKIMWSEDAEVYEYIPEKRSNINWILKRKFRTSNCYTYILLLEKDYPKIVYKLSKSLFYLIFGIPLMALSLFPFRSKYKGFIKMTEALGGLSAIFSLKFNEYKGSTAN